MTYKDIVLFIRLSRPQFLLGAAIFYALGAGIAHYLGKDIDVEVYVLGQIWVSLCQLSAQYLNEYFNAEADEKNSNRTMLTGGSGALGPGKLPRRVALYAAFTTLALLASISVLLYARANLVIPTILIMFFALFVSIFYSMPPIRLEASGYGELAVSVLVAFLTPAFAYLLQTGEWHRLVAMGSFPLTALHLAMLLAMELPDYANDLKFNKQPLLIRMGWQNGFVLHNVLILSAFLLFSINRMLGYPWFATLAGLLAFPIGVFQIWQMRRISSGSKPNWTALTVGAVALLIVTTYLITFSFWIN
jgi:1,4-dihydroxy-2-naphthoate octaprenyltransferase